MTIKGAWNETENEQPRIDGHWDSGWRFVAFSDRVRCRKTSVPPPKPFGATQAGGQLSGHPDYLQIDCKGHPGYSSYPTAIGNPVPGFVGDPLRVWRQVTADKGVALYMHYSGVWDYAAVAKHPDWAAVGADGKPSTKAASVFGPYADELLIPQLRELASVYGHTGTRRKRPSSPRKKEGM